MTGLRVTVDYANRTRCPMTARTVSAIVRSTLRKSDASFLSKKPVQMEVAVVSREDMRQMNKTYRGRDRVTDVLSFGEDGSSFSGQTPAVFLGQIILCYDYIAEMADRDKVPVAQEWAYVLSHGVLHLLGWEHSEAMFAIQDEVSRL